MNIYNYIYFYENDCSVITHKSILVISNSRKGAIDILKSSDEIVEDLLESDTTITKLCGQSAVSFWSLSQINDDKISISGEPRLHQISHYKE